MFYHDLSTSDRDRLERAVESLSSLIPAGDLNHTLDLWRSSAWSLSDLWEELEYFAPSPEAKERVWSLMREFDQ